MVKVISRVNLEVITLRERSQTRLIEDIWLFIRTSRGKSIKSKQTAVVWRKGRKENDYLVDVGFPLWVMRTFWNQMPMLVCFPGH